MYPDRATDLMIGLGLHVCADSIYRLSWAARSKSQTICVLNSKKIILLSSAFRIRK